MSSTGCSSFAAKTYQPQCTHISRRDGHGAVVSTTSLRRFTTTPLSKTPRHPFITPKPWLQETTRVSIPELKTICPFSKASNTSAIFALLPSCRLPATRWWPVPWGRLAYLWVLQLGSYPHDLPARWSAATLRLWWRVPNLHPWSVVSVHVHHQFDVLRPTANCERTVAWMNQCVGWGLHIDSKPLLDPTGINRLPRHAAAFCYRFRWRLLFRAVCSFILLTDTYQDATYLGLDATCAVSFRADNYRTLQIE